MQFKKPIRTSYARDFTRTFEWLRNYGLHNCSWADNFRYAYVNVRPWISENPSFENPLKPPPISQDVALYVVDLVTQQILPQHLLSGHKAFTPAVESLFLFLDVSQNFVARWVFVFSTFGCC